MTTFDRSVPESTGRTSHEPKSSLENCRTRKRLSAKTTVDPEKTALDRLSDRTISRSGYAARACR
ncbi:hypothetical protein EA473_13110 [Natrarchaeobius chitinivorans]|uniref:Uncharacterized protein n=1 Tax=Natrarchaeobius chitinivorans TaxID=1679083 RepID=A0A3N6N6L5_NATCH|nr:hypothetical protein EA473_13110 [Natrarchaeobius chitinivorans]